MTVSMIITPTVERSTKPVSLTCVVQNATYLSITHVISPLYRATSHHNTTRLIHFHNIHVLNDQNTISLNQSISINTQALCNRYTKTQSYMQCGTMSMKNLIGR